MRKSAVTGCVSIAALTVAFIAMSVHSQPVVVTPVPSPTPIRPFPIGPGPGGTYGGPGDTVPPGGGGTGGGACANINCSAPATPCGNGTTCSVAWTPRNVPGCYNCSCDENLHPIISYDLRFDTLWQLCNTSCGNANGDITVQITIQNACDAQVFMSDWLVFGAFSGYPSMPPLGSVVVSPCINNSCSPFGCATLGTNCRTDVSSNCLDCDSATISLTFNRTCMCNALLSWISVLSNQGISYDTYKNNWMLNVSATSCQICE